MTNDSDVGMKPSVSILGGVGWLIFIIVWFAFYASEYPWEKNIAVILLSILAIFILIGGMWGIWSIRKIPAEGWEIFKISGFRWRVILSITMPLISIIFLIIWFWYFAVPYSIWQNIAVLLVFLLAMSGVLSALWARWSMKHGHEMKRFEDMGEEIGKRFEESFENEKKW